MNNYYDEQIFDSIKETSLGVRYAKRIVIGALIALLYCLAFVFLEFFFIGRKFSLVLYDGYKTSFILAGIMFYFTAFGTIIFIVKKSVSKLELQEKIFYNLYMANTICKFLRGLRLSAIIAMAQLEAKKGDRQMCLNALSLWKRKSRHRTYVYLNEWASGNEVLDETKLLKRAKNIFSICLILSFFFMGLFSFILPFDKETLLSYGVPNSLLDSIQLLAALGISFLYGGILTSLVIRNSTAKKKVALFTAIFIVAFLANSFIFVDFIREAIIGSNESIEDYEYANGTYGDYNSYDSYDTYDDQEDFYIDNTSEPLDDLDIMSYMCTLSYYLCDQGIVDDLTDFKLDYSAKGVVKGKIYFDQDFEYNLYDNGIKEDENGNECIELVLEAEPLDEEGFSKGQSEAILKGFYLVNLETSEIIDEHKTHW